MFIGKASLKPANSPRFLISRKSGAAIALRKSFIPKLFFHPHGNCFWQYKSNFVNFLQNAPQAKPRFCAAELNSRILALRRKGTAARGSDRCQLRAAGKPDAEPKANVGFSFSHGNCFCQFKSNFVNSYSKIALILLTPAEEDCSLTILKCPKTPVLAT